MSQIGPGANPYGPQPGQPPAYPQPVVYRPGGAPGMPMPGMPGAPMVPGAAPAYGAPDAYRPGMPPRGPMGAGQPQAAEPPYEYVSQKDVAFGVLGAVGGFFLAGLVGLSGPIGALILGLALMGLSSVTRAVQHNSKKKEQQNIQAGMPAPPQYPQPQQYQNRYNTQMTPQQQDPRYRYPQ